MLSWHVLALSGLGLTVTPAFASPSSPAALPPDFLCTVLEIQGAYARKDVEGIISHHALDCTFLVSSITDRLQDFRITGRRTRLYRRATKWMRKCGSRARRAGN